MGLRAVAGPRIPAARCHNLGPSQPKPIFSIRAPKSAAPSADISWSANLRAKCLLQNPRSILAVTPPMDRCAESNDWIHTIHGDDFPMQNCFTNQNDYGYNNNCCGDSSSCTGPCPADYAGVNSPSNGYNSTPAYAGFNGPSNGWNAPTYAGFNGFNSTPAYAGFNGPSNGWNAPTYAGFNGYNSTPGDAGFNGPSNGWNAPTFAGFNGYNSTPGDAGFNGPSNGWNAPTFAGFNGYNSTPAYAGFNGPSNGWNAPTFAGFNGFNSTPAYAGFNGPSNGWESTSTTWNGFANVPAPETTVPGATPTQNCGPQSWTGCCGTEAA